jgi:putative transposase
MARALRIEAAGLSYHVWARGSGRMDIYLDDGDRERFLELLGRTVTSHDLDCHAYCLMMNHYHMVITTNNANLSHAIQQVNSPYAQWWNTRHSRPGHVFQGRFGAQVVQDEAYLLTVCRYVVLNPVRAGVVSAPEEWPWSSYRATARLDSAPAFLHPDALWRHFEIGNDTAVAARRYREFVGLGDGGRALPRDLILGDKTFVDRFNDRRRTASREVPRRDRSAPPPLEEFFGQAFTSADRAARACAAHAAGYTLTQIAAFLDLHHTTISKMVTRVVAAGSHP